MTTIQVDKLVKRFGKIEAVQGISFNVDQGELFGLLGPNGAGKTTTINMLTGLARPDAGAIRIRGTDCTRNPKAAQRLIGVVPDESNLYPELTGFENLCFCATLYGIRKRERQTRAEELLEKFDLADAAQREFAGYSKGMKRKLTIAAGIIHQPAILFLDEPEPIRVGLLVRFLEDRGVEVAEARRARPSLEDVFIEITGIEVTAMKREKEKAGTGG